MFIRRIFYYWQYIAIIALPVWLMVGWGVFGGGGWGFLGLIISAPATFLALGAVALLVGARPSVRREKTLSWIDVVMWIAWHGSIIGIGFYGQNAALFTVTAILTGVVAFWLALWQMLREGAQKVNETFADFERQAAGQTAAGPASAEQKPAAPRFSPGPTDDVIIIHESRK